MMYTGLLGENIGYSKSPEIHREYYEKNNLPFKYRIFDVKEISYFIKESYRENIVGFNVTIPYKTKILEHVQELVYPANKIGAVNTVVVLKDKLIGFNTDYYGFIESLKIRNIDLKDRNALIIGNGGAALCVYCALMDIGCKNLDVLCRNKDKNREKLKKIRHFYNYHEIHDYKQYDIIVNCTPLGGANYIDILPIDLKKINLKTDVIIYDLNYNPPNTFFIKQAKSIGKRAINGEDMLKFQAYEAVNIWKKYILK